MNGAQALINALVEVGVDISFTNPGTSEMHFVAALDDVPGMRGILCLFEGVATGAADGYARIAGKPAATLLHLGPGLGNGFANLHNARRGSSPVLNIVGDHAIDHKPLDAPLESDIDAVASACSKWVRRSMHADDVVSDAQDAIDAAMSGRPGVATLILPADVCWQETSGAASVRAATTSRAAVPALEPLIEALGASNAVLFIGGAAMSERGLLAAHRVAAATGAKLLSETFPAKLQRGAGRPAVDRLIYLAEFAQMQIGEAAALVAIGAPEPVSFFAYPEKPSRLVPPGCVVTVVDPETDPVAVLEALADELGVGSAEVPVVEAGRPAIGSGPLTAEGVATVVGALLPDNAIVIDEGNTSGLYLGAATAGCPPHDWCCLTGGAIGMGIPLATGAALAAPDRPVLCMQADGSALYTLQGLWTQAREGCNVVTVIYANRSYAVLNMELNRVGADNSGEKAQAMLDLTNPIMDFVQLSEGLGVPATRATTVEEFAEQLAAAFATPGPVLIEAVIPSIGL